MAGKSLNMRETYGRCLVELGKRCPDVVALEADVGKSTRSLLFQEQFPERYFEMGIAEQNMAGAAAGLAIVGKKPFMHSFAVFATGRVYDQLRQSICIPNLDVKICGSSAGLSDYTDGSTHQSVEDIALMRAMPNMTVLSPADAHEVELVMDTILDIAGPVYLRLNRNDLPLLKRAPDIVRHRRGEAELVKDGTDLAVFATGIMVHKALEAAAELDQSGISTRVINVCSIKPLAVQTVLSLVGGARGVITAEEHTVHGGLGAAIAEILVGHTHPPMRAIGIADRFGTTSRNYEQLLEHFGLTAGAIAAAGRQLLAGR